MGNNGVFSILVLMAVLHSLIKAEISVDRQTLLEFAKKMPHSRALNWEQASSTCSNWTGVTCSKDGSHVIALRLPGFGLTGAIPLHTLSRLTGLQVLSLRSNRISGNFPLDFYNLKSLSFLYLHNNALSGPLPLDWSLWPNLTFVNLSYNRFNGSIPISMSSLKHLTGLNLANNLLSGEIPDLDLPRMQIFNVSNNNLTGEIPSAVRRFPAPMFAGNNLSVSSNPNAGIHETRRASRISETVLLTTLVIAGISLFALLVILIIVYRNRKGSKVEYTSKSKKAGMSPEKVASRNQDGSTRMVFFPGCVYAFDLDDLLTASAEVLGKGTFGMTYKANLEDGTTVVVKRLKEVNAGKREFEQQMDVIGNIQHDNVAAIKAYYYCKDEKLVVYDHYPEWSVSSLLHGGRGSGRSQLDWNARMKIAIGAARGLARIHTSKLVHGNVKTSNVFLNSQGFGCVAEHGLFSIMSSLAAPLSRAAGYRAPEVTDTRKATQASDVYSYGVVVLELLTGKSPIQTTSGDEMIHLVRWVQSVVREEWTAEVFDVELMKYAKIEEELVEMLQIAMSCVVRVADQRPRMVDLVKSIESVRSVHE